MLSLRARCAGVGLLLAVLALAPPLAAQTVTIDTTQTRQSRDSVRMAARAAPPSSADSARWQIQACYQTRTRGVNSAKTCKTQTLPWLRKLAPAPTPPPPPADTSGTLVFAEDFEQGRGTWDDDGFVTAQSVTPAFGAARGTRALQVTIAGGSTGGWLAKYLRPGHGPIRVEFA